MTDRRTILTWIDTASRRQTLYYESEGAAAKAAARAQGQAGWTDVQNVNRYELAKLEARPLRMKRFTCFHRLSRDGRAFKNGQTYAYTTREALANFKRMTPTASRHFVVWTGGWGGQPDPAEGPPRTRAEASSQHAATA